MTHPIRLLRRSVAGMTVLVVVVIAFLIFYRCDNYMFGWEAGIFWGRAPFVSQQFREAAPNEKATMIADLVSKKYFIGKSIEQVDRELGASTGGYYNTDTNRTYTVRIDGETIWDIVFIADPSTGSVEHVLIYKRHGGVSRKILEAIMKIADK